MSPGTRTSMTADGASTDTTADGAGTDSRPDADRVVDAQTRRIGEQIRARRRAAGLTLVQVAAATGLSHPFLSQVERGHSRASMVSLEKIAAALGTTQVALLAAGAPEHGGHDGGAPEVLRAGEGARGPSSDGEARLLVHAGPHAFEPLEWTGEHTDLGEYFEHGEDEFLTVLSGHVLLDLRGQEPIRLGPGDSVYHRGGTAHRWCSADGGRFHMLVVKETPRVGGVA
ncbi:helix-turn-helix domain-containing protein [Curtobacterium sp. MCBA15_012]|uniref:helix-turn-helix domain-containing protein n=1 Tax=Curtobacterium sp. MCBA15_012 TaxID=1898738 RepID=UPI000A490A41|nr:XRE family transcriptional regulator [Curtobacterium sp. MCBA15_012]WIA99320.1 XRE family transcriptional regulator [Curtobacterium sp. MCBA15_012]